MSNEVEKKIESYNWTDWKSFPIPSDCGWIDGSNKNNLRQIFRKILFKPYSIGVYQLRDVKLNKNILFGITTLQTLEKRMASLLPTRSGGISGRNNPFYLSHTIINNKKETTMSKIKILFHQLMKKLSTLFKWDSNKENENRNVFGTNGDLEMIEYAKMVALIRNHYQIQSKRLGHLDLDQMMTNLSKMTYVEIKALFAAILQIQMESKNSYDLEKKSQELDHEFKAH